MGLVRQTAAQYNKIGRCLSWNKNEVGSPFYPTNIGVFSFSLRGGAPSGGQIGVGSLGEITWAIIEL
jgi:hypothetical protein